MTIVHSSVEELVDYIKYLDRNDTAYQEYLSWKTLGPTPEWKALIGVPRLLPLLLPLHTPLLFSPVQTCRSFTLSAASASAQRISCGETLETRLRLTSKKTRNSSLDQRHRSMVSSLASLAIVSDTYLILAAFKVRERGTFFFRQVFPTSLTLSSLTAAIVERFKSTFENRQVA
jgi:hypothetical protein